MARNAIQELKPQIIINAAAYTAVDQAESEPKEAFQVNASAVRELAEEAKQTSSLLVHYSTDYVFDGSKSSPYLESDNPNPLSVYGKTKLAGEQVIQESGCHYLIFRTAWIYATRGKNFLRTILGLARQKPELNIVNDQRGAPTLARDVALATMNIISKASTNKREVYHMTARGETTWYGFAEEIVKDVAGRGLQAAKLRPIPTSEYPTPAKRPLNSVLSSDKLFKDFGVRLPDWRESLRGVLRELDV